jgi:hypothetical protein
MYNDVAITPVWSALRLYGHSHLALVRPRTARGPMLSDVASSERVVIEDMGSLPRLVYSTMVCKRSHSPSLSPVRKAHSARPAYELPETVATSSRTSVGTGSASADPDVARSSSSVPSDAPGARGSRRPAEDEVRLASFGASARRWAVGAVGCQSRRQLTSVRDAARSNRPASWTIRKIWDQLDKTLAIAAGTQSESAGMRATRQKASDDERRGSHVSARHPLIRASRR